MKKATTSIEETLNVLFEEVKNSYYRAPLSGLEIIEDVSLLEILSGKTTAFFNWLTFKVGINVPFVKKLAEKGDLDKIVKGIYSHEFGHYFFHPMNFSMQLYLSYMAEKNFKEAAGVIYPLFTDFENNHLVIDNDFCKDELKETLKSQWKISEKGALRTALFLVYNNSIHLGLDIDLGRFDKDKTEKIKTAVKELKEIVITSFQDYGLQYSQLLRFGVAIEPLIEKIEIPCFGLGDGAGRLIKPEDIPNLPQDLRGKIEEALRKLIKNLPKHLYDEIKKHFLGEEKEGEQPSLGIGHESENLKLADKKTIEYYRDAAKEFGIYIRPKRMLSLSTVKIPFGKKDFKPTDSPLGIDLGFSGGKIFPGLAQTVRREMIPYPATKEIIPNLILYKDASGSMLEPAKTKCYGTIAGSIFVLSYLRSGSLVGIAIFDSESSEVFYSRKEDELLTVLCAYKGGGTAVDMGRLKKDLEARKEYLPFDISMNIEELKRNPLFKKYLIKKARITGLERLKQKQTTDFVIISDGGIANMDELINFFKENEQYRPTILHTGGYDIDLPGYDQQTSGVYEGINILKAENREDIINLTKKTIKKNLLSKYFIK